jgi:predicted 2-oxoglutarate/Fe(II)-dependent dioxygenase YbiX
MLGGNYLIAQQLPASSPFLQAITVYIMRQIYARAFFIFFQVFLTCKSSVFNMYMVRTYDTHPRVLF